MFAKLFPPLFATKWRHRNPQVRRAALEALSPDAAESQGIFATVAQEDEDAAIRGLAIRRLQDVGLLRRLASDGREAEDRDGAEQQLAQLLCGPADHGPDSDARRHLLTELNDARWFERVLQGAADAELRRFALARVDRQSLLGDVALSDADGEIRLGALAKITQRSTLERVAKGARRRDKQVYARVREVLDALDAAERRPRELREQADKLCVQVEALVKATRHNPNWESIAAGISQTALQWDDLVAELPALPAEESVAFAARFRQATDTVAQDLAAWREAREIARREEAAEAERRAAAAARQAVEDASALAEAESRLDAVLADIRGLSAEEIPSASRLARLEQAWAGVPRQLQLDTQKVAQVEEGLAALGARIQESQQRQQAQAEKFAALVGQLEGYLRADTYKPAFDVVQQAQQLLDGLPEPARHALLKKSLLRRWQQVQAQLQEMRDWRQWANAPVMERLCEDMERLAAQAEQHADDEAFDFADCAARVRAAREEWKQLTSARSGAPKALWRRFDAACTRAYAPCEARFGEEHQQREVHLAAKEIICQGLEEYSARVAGQPFDLVDWSGLEQIIQKADAEWKAAGPVPRAALTASNKRFRKIMERLRAQLQEHYQRNRDAKEELIQRVAGLLMSAQEGRLSVAEVVEKTKAAQGEWKGIGRAAKDGELWRRFRAACDAVFQLRDAEKTARREALAADVAVYQALCEQLDAAVEKAGTEPGPARQDVERIQAQWREAPRLPKRESEQWERRLRAALERFEQRVRAERNNARQQARQRLRDKAALCDALEGLVEKVVAGDAAPETVATEQAELVAQWDALGAISGPLVKGVEQRYAEALAWLERLQAESPAALRQEFETLRQVNLERRLDLCLQMEILTGAETPTEYREARLRSQVENLALHMKSGEQRDTAARAAELEAAWYATAALPSAQSPDLERRFTGASPR